jgi:imidazolonepropionase
MKKLFTHIKELVQVREEHELLKGKAMQSLPSIENAWLLVENGRIVSYGNMNTCPFEATPNQLNCEGKYILPTWVDSHTHLIYAGNREQEFIARIKGLSYEEIANQGGGILNSASLLQNTSEDDLYLQAKKRLDEVIMMGTGAIEIKSGYGLTKDAELKMLRVAQRLKQAYDLPIKITFLAAHALPVAWKDRKTEYVTHIIDEILPEVATQKLADFIDVFCEKGYFDLEDTQRILEAGKKHGLPAKIHVNQFNAFGGVQVATKHQALSVDHLEVMNDEDFSDLQQANTIPVALPSCSLFLGIPYTPGRKIIDKNLALAIASDYNPGSTPSGNMNLVVSLACIKMKLTPEEAINAATLNAAYAMQVEDEVGSITIGKRANFLITKPIPSIGFLPYAFGTLHIESVYISGIKQELNNPT